MIGTRDKMSATLQAVLVFGSVAILVAAVQFAVTHTSSEDCYERNTYDDAGNILTSQVLCR